MLIIAGLISGFISGIGMGGGTILIILLTNMTVIVNEHNDFCPRKHKYSSIRNE